MIIVFDTETTGLTDPQPIQVAWLELSDNPLHPKDNKATSEHFKPSKPIEWGAMATHHMLAEDLRHCRPSSEARLENVTYLIGHNVDFDWKVMGSPPVKRICTQALSRSLWPALDSHKQSAVYYFLFGANEESRRNLTAAHDAKVDVENCVRILFEICRIKGITTAAALHAASEYARIPTHMAFGKHKGKRVEEVDKGYVAWYQKQEDPDPYLLEAFRRAGILTIKPNR